MADIDANSNQTVTKVVSLVVAIVVFALVLVPIINSVSDSGGGGGGAGYTNTGEYYFKSPAEGESHTIIVSLDDNVMTMTYDGEPFKSITLGYDSFLIPIVLDTLLSHPDPNYQSPVMSGLWYAPIGINSLEYTVWNTGPDFFYLEDGDKVTYMIDGDTFTYYMNDEIQYMDSGHCTAYLTNDTNGEYVYAECPVVENDSDIIVYDGYGECHIPPDVPNGWYRWWDWYDMTTLDGLSTLSSDNTVGNMESDWLGNGGNYDTISEYAVTDVSTTQMEVGTKIDSVVLHTVWDNNEVIDYTIDKFIVPTQVGSGTGSDSGSDSDNGTVGTLISIIPVFVALGILLAIIGMFYNPTRNQ